MVWVFLLMLMLANVTAWLMVRKGRLVAARPFDWTRPRRLRRLARLAWLDVGFIWALTAAWYMWQVILLKRSGMTPVEIGPPFSALFKEACHVGLALLVGSVYPAIAALKLKFWAFRAELDD